MIDKIKKEIKIKEDLYYNPYKPPYTKCFVIEDVIGVDILSYKDPNTIFKEFIYEVLDTYPFLCIAIKQLVNYYNFLIEFNKYQRIKYRRINQHYKIRVSSMTIDCANIEKLQPRHIYLSCNSDPILDLNTRLLITIREEESFVMDIIIFSNRGGKYSIQFDSIIKDENQVYKFMNLFTLMDRLDRNNSVY